jgi:hypothetical protein
MLVYLWPFGMFCVHLVYFVVIWNVLPLLGMFYQEKSAQPWPRPYVPTLARYLGRSGNYNFLLTTYIEISKWKETFKLLRFETASLATPHNWRLAGFLTVFPDFGARRIYRQKNWGENRRLRAERVLLPSSLLTEAQIWKRDCCFKKKIFSLVFAFESGLPDFYWSMIPKMYQINTKSTKCS